MKSSETKVSLAQCNVQNYLEGRVELDQTQLLELIQEAFPKRSTIDQLNMLFAAQKLRKNKKLDGKAKYTKVSGIGNPMPEGMSYGSLPEGVLPEKK